MMDTLYAKTIRPKQVTIQALDENGWELILPEGEMAKCFCHELEYLAGEIITDKVIKFISPVK